ncbi:MAG TPA: hypothetical protein DCK95_11065 [Anaerolineaceae bacterium]|nr:hypothetical protein [Anaerolineaceae bacterium]
MNLLTISCFNILYIVNQGVHMKLKVGQHAPDFTLPSHLDKDLTMSDLRGKTVVMAFFPLAWTPV